MNTRFHVDLLHPGWVAQTWQDWFTGARGGRRLAAFAVAGVAMLAVILVSGVLPTSWRLTADRNALPALRDTLAARDADLGLLRANLQGLSQEARRQVHWADLLTTFGRHIPGALRLQLVETQRSSPPTPPGQPAAAQSKVDESLRIEALTSLRPGSAPLVDVAQFIAGLMRDPAVSRRFELKSWEIKPSPAATATGEQFLNVSILLVERPR